MDWEYHIEGMVLGGDMADFQETLNGLGFKKWEAVSTWTETPKKGQSFVFVLFKRPRSQ